MPAAHLSHVGLPTSGWKVPGLHLVCSVLPAGEKWPAFVPGRERERERGQSSIAPKAHDGKPTIFIWAGAISRSVPVQSAAVPRPVMFE